MHRFIALLAVVAACGGGADRSEVSQNAASIAPQCGHVPLPDRTGYLEGSVRGKAGTDECTGVFKQGEHQWEMDCRDGLCTCSYDGIEQCTCASVCPRVCCPPGEVSR